MAKRSVYKQNINFIMIINTAGITIGSKSIRGPNHRSKQIILMTSPPDREKW